VTVSERIDCMECGGRATAQLAQLLDPEMPVRAGDVLVYICSDCAQRWDVVVDEADLEDPDD
jgi:DNA-directed RNA polymerase subunit RPC12/RpoP